MRGKRCRSSIQTNQLTVMGDAMELDSDQLVHHHAYPFLPSQTLHQSPLSILSPSISPLIIRLPIFGFCVKLYGLRMDPPLQALIAAACSFFFVSAVFLLILLCRRSRKPVLPHSHPSTTTPTPPRLAPPLEEGASFDPNLPQISLSELTAATANFSPATIVGDGSFGFVYKATLSSGATVAVKRLSADAFHGLREFRAEMETLGRVRHPNLTRLLGYCTSGADKILIYEFFNRGSLDTWLHDPASGQHPLPWPVRRRIAAGAAAGLAFLHHECRPRIIHRDIKSSNVLLDDGFEAKIADFGLARRVESSRSHVSTQVAGTMGYMPPEYREGVTAATVQADVYSFGVVMMELVTGRRPNWPVRKEGGGEEPLVLWMRRMVEEGRGMETVDREMGTMGTEGMVEEEVKEFIGVAYQCTEELRKKRPRMDEVVSMLDQLK